MGGPVTGGAITGIIIPTAVQTSADVISYWTSMTCLYDPKWFAERSRITLPIAFFHMVSIKEICQTVVSEKRVILYEPQANSTATGSKSVYKASDLANRFRQSALRTIIDNAVKKAKTYEIEAVVPFQPIGNYVKDGLSVLTGTLGSFATLLGMDGNHSLDWTSYLSYALSAVGTVQTAVDEVAKLPSMNDASYINKNSLEAMWDRMHYLCFKMWTGFDYKYVMITGLNFDKKPTEDDVFRVSMQLTETPVLTITKPSTVMIEGINRNAIAGIVANTQKALITPLAAMMGVEAETGVTIASMGGEI